MSRRFSAQTMRDAWDRCGGRCEFIRDGIRCNAELAPGNRIYDHADAHEVSRNSGPGNCQVICTDCNRHKTALDAARIAKTRHMRDFHLGITGPGLGHSPLPGGRRDRDGRPGKWRKTFRRGVVPRVTQQEAHRRMIAKRYPGGRL